MNKRFTLIEMDCNHIKSVVAIHLKAFSGFFLSFLGSNFLRVFYSGVIEDPSGIAYVVLDHNNLVGFVAGSSHPNGFFKRMLTKKWIKFGFAALPAILSDPRIVPRLLRAVTLPNQELPQSNCGTLLSIAVDPDCQGGGIGSKLVIAFLEEAKELGLDAINLTTDAVNNEKTNQFYRKLGFDLYRNYKTPEGRSINEYIYHLENI